MTISGGGRGFGTAGFWTPGDALRVSRWRSGVRNGGCLGVPLGVCFLPRQMGWLCTDHGGGLVLGVCGALPSKVSEAGR